MTRDELAELAGRYRAALWTAKPEEVTILLTRLSVHYWQPDRPAAHWDVLLADYLDDLCRYPLDLVDYAITEYRRSGEKWFPKVCELVGLIAPKCEARRAQLASIESLMAQRARQAPPPAREEASKAFAECKAVLADPGPKPIGEVVEAIRVDMTDEQREAMLRKIEGA